MTGDRRHSAWVPVVLLGATVLVLGMNWPLLAIGLEEISPLWLVTLRLQGATLVIFTVSFLTGRLQAPRRSDRPVLLSVAVGRLILVMALVFTALQLVPPGRASVLVWTSSLWTVPIAVAFLGEHMNRRRWLGIILATAGIGVMVEPWTADIDLGTLTGYGLLLAAAVVQAATAVHIRYHRWESIPIELLPWQLLVAMVPMTIATLALEGIPSIEWSPLLVFIVAYQGTLATGFAMWAQLTVLRILPAITTNFALMMVPVIGLVSSIIVVDETLTPAAAIATGMIGSGVLLGVGLRTGAAAPSFR